MCVECFGIGKEGGTRKQPPPPRGGGERERGEGGKGEGTTKNIETSGET